MMMSTGPIRYGSACLLLGLGFVAACGAGGASSAPQFEDDSPPPITPGAPSSPSTPENTPTLPPAGLLPEAPSAQGSGSGPASCVGVSAEVELLRQPVDIVIAIDNSGSMDDETRAVEENLNVNFAEILEQSGIDYRVILVTEHRESDGQDTAVCIASPLSSLSACPSDAPGPSARFFKGCRKIDFLFVIDNSDSMEDEQANLARSFPGFIRVMRQVLEATDFHIMVVATGGDPEDDDEPALDAEECEEIQGAGHRQSEQGEECGITGGLPFMLAEQPDLEATFSCLALVGTDGSAFERPMDAVLAATGATLNAPGRCNAGFLRDDAVLVVTFITDEEDQRSQGEPADWRQALLDIKPGKDDALVLLGLVGDNNVDGGLLGGPCGGLDADGSPRLQEFVSSVDGVLGSVCAPDYTPFFQTAVGSIDSACSDFEAPAAP